MSEEKDITKLPLEVVKKVTDTASEVAKTAMEIAEKAVKVVTSAATGAAEGVKKSNTGRSGTNYNKEERRESAISEKEILRTKVLRMTEKD
jgi:hypothetical protein